MAKKRTNIKGRKQTTKNNAWKGIIVVVVMAFLLFQVFQVVAHTSNSADSTSTKQEQHAEIFEDTESLNDNENYAISSTIDTDIEYVIVSDSIPNEVVKYTGFTVYFNCETHIPNCTVYELTSLEAAGDFPRDDNFHQDENLEGCPSLDDYKYSGYDRGHMVPAGDMKWSQSAMNDCFSLANMVPQKNALNSGAWNKLEQKVRNWVVRDEALIVITGPIVTESDKNITIGETGVVVPGSLYKIVLAHKATPIRAIAIVYPNMKPTGGLEQHITTIDEVEKATGLDFFSALPDDIEDEIEAVSDLNQWNKKAKKQSK